MTTEEFFGLNLHQFNVIASGGGTPEFLAALEELYADNPAALNFVRSIGGSSEYMDVFHRYKETPNRGTKRAIRRALLNHVNNMTFKA